MRKSKRLSLSKETVRTLASREIEPAAGAWSEPTGCVTYCRKCIEAPTRDCPPTYDVGCSYAPECSSFC